MYKGQCGCFDVNRLSMPAKMNLYSNLKDVKVTVVSIVTEYTTGFV